jgi:uncharacterized protein YciI
LWCCKASSYPNIWNQNKENKMLYVLFGEDIPNSLERRLAVRPQHLERLQALKDEGRLILAGPCPAIDSPTPGPAGFTGSMIVADFPSLQQAQAWLAADPYTLEGVFQKTRVLPYLKVLP